MHTLKTKLASLEQELQKITKANKQLESTANGMKKASMQKDKEIAELETQKANMRQQHANSKT